MVVRLNPTLSIDPAARGFQAAAELIVEAGRAKGQGLGALGAGLLAGVRAAASRRQHSEDMQAQMSERDADRAQRADFHQNEVDMQGIQFAKQKVTDIQSDIARQTLYAQLGVPGSQEKVAALQQDLMQWKNVGDTKASRVFGFAKDNGMLPQFGSTQSQKEADWATLRAAGQPGGFGPVPAPVPWLTPFSGARASATVGGAPGSTGNLLPADQQEKVTGPCLPGMACWDKEHAESATPKPWETSGINKPGSTPAPPAKTAPAAVRTTPASPIDALTQDEERKATEFEMAQRAMLDIIAEGRKKNSDPVAQSLAERIATENVTKARVAYRVAMETRTKAVAQQLQDEAKAKAAAREQALFNSVMASGGLEVAKGAASDFLAEYFKNGGTMEGALALKAPSLLQKFKGNAGRETPEEAFSLAKARTEGTLAAKPPPETPEEKVARIKAESKARAEGTLEAKPEDAAATEAKRQRLVNAAEVAMKGTVEYRKLSELLGKKGSVFAADDIDEQITKAEEALRAHPAYKRWEKLQTEISSEGGDPKQTADDAKAFLDRWRAENPNGTKEEARAAWEAYRGSKR